MLQIWRTKYKNSYPKAKIYDGVEINRPDCCAFKVQYDHLKAKISDTQVISHLFSYVKQKALAQAGGDIKKTMAVIA